jgi:hypothetical protein
MNRDKVIKWTTNIAVISIVLLLYWVFAFTAITVFGLKVFQENITQSFYLSILGILVLLCGSLIVNVILNLSKIADAIAGKRPQEQPETKKSRSIYGWAFAASFVVLFGGLYLGDYASSVKKKNTLVASAQYLVEKNTADIKTLAAYTFDAAYLSRAGEILSVLSKQNSKAPMISMIVNDAIDGKQVFLEVSRYFPEGDYKHKPQPRKATYIHSCTPEVCEYLKTVFDGRQQQYHFSAHDGSYELYYPVVTAGRIIVMYFSDRAQYGKLGS